MTTYLSGLEQQNVVIIGGSSGMGLACAELCAKGGARVTIASRNPDKAMASDVIRNGNVFVVTVDVRDERSVQTLFAELSKPIDHLIVTASEGVIGSFKELESERARAFFDSKFWGQYYCCLHGSKALRPNGSITLFGGVESRKATPRLSTAAAIDAAIEALCKSLARELAPIRVNCIAPGPILTPLYDKLSLPAREEFFAYVERELPLHRLGSAEEIAHITLAVVLNGFITGTVVDIDGGALLAPS